MISALFVRDIVLIDRLEINLSSGLVVLTGETGAGKSILLDSLSLALGARGDQSLVRMGADQGVVSASFDLAPAHPVFSILHDSAIDVDGALLLRRVQYKDGRTKAFINDQPVSAKLMHQVGQALVEIHGQHDDRALVDPASHRNLLDTFGELLPLTKKVSSAFSILAAAKRALVVQLAKVERVRTEEDYARHVVEEIDALALEENEEQGLAERRSHLQTLEKSADEVREADEILNSAKSPAATIAVLARRLERKGSNDENLFEPLLNELTSVMDGLGRAQDALQGLVQELDFDPNELNGVEERLFALRAMARKHDVQPDDLLGVRAKYATELELLQSSEIELEQLQTAVQEAETAYNDLAAKLSQKRQAAGKRLAQAVMKELPDLKLGGASFIVEVEADETRMSESGYDHVGFLVQTNPGTLPGPIMKVASGGELSRFLLALKVVLADKASAPVLVFDEIDTGVGGAVADAMGQRLARLADSVQVLTVTHAPQVAARATHHMLIEKSVGAKGDAMRTNVRPLDAAERDEEIARMLAGSQITNEARAAAKSLIAGVA